MSIILIRHGATAGNLKGRYIGVTDEPILPGTAAERKYPAAHRIVCSPLKRCVMTAELIYPNREYELCPELAETDFGRFENKSYEDMKDDPEYIKWLVSGGTLPFPGGEPHEHFKARCISAFCRIMSGGADDVAFIVHGGTIMAVMQHLFGGGFYDYQVPNLGGYIVRGNIGDHTATKNALDYCELV